jgi:hypothetical protein
MPLAYGAVMNAEASANPSSELESTAFDDQLLLARIPEAPRALPPGFARKQLLNVRLILGGAFGLVGSIFVGVCALLAARGEWVMTLWFAAPTLSGLAVAARLARLGWRTGRGHIEAYRAGVATAGEVWASGPDRSTEVNGRNPWLVQFAFVVEGVQHSGSHSSWDHTWGATQTEGRRVGVVYLPADPASNCLFPAM